MGNCPSLFFVYRIDRMTHKYLITDEGVIHGWTEALSKHPRMRPYVPPAVEIKAPEPQPEPVTEHTFEGVVHEVEAEPVKALPPIDLNLCSKMDAVLYAKENFGVDLKMTSSLTKLRSEVSALIGNV